METIKKICNALIPALLILAAATFVLLCFFTGLTSMGAGIFLFEALGTTIIAIASGFVAKRGDLGNWWLLQIGLGISGLLVYLHAASKIADMLHGL